MCTICGIHCENCLFNGKCMGCAATCGKPFGGSCIAAEYIKTGGKENYLLFKQHLLEEVNSLLISLNLPISAALYELAGSYVNLAYPLPNGGTVQFLNEKNIYLGCQIELPDSDRCIGVIADTTCIIICTYGCGGTDPELVLFKKR